jgi:hypothetical protein
MKDKRCGAASVAWADDGGGHPPPPAVLMLPISRSPFMASVSAMLYLYNTTHVNWLLTKNADKPLVAVDQLMTIWLCTS